MSSITGIHAETGNRVIVNVDTRPLAVIVFHFTVLLAALLLMTSGCISESLCHTMAGGFLMITTAKLLKG